MSLFVYLSISILLIYCLLLLVFFTGWAGLEQFLPRKPDSYRFVSVVLAFRNEEKNIGLLLNDLAHQSYPVDQFEIILVNDHSDDGSAEIVKNHRMKGKVKIVSLNLPDQLAGKKDALNLGIESSKGKYILTTDADCRVHENWINSFASFIHLKESPKLIMGLVDLIPSGGILSGLQNLEFLSLMISGAGAAGIRKPIYCNSANLMFDRDTYRAIRDPLRRNIASGDDTFLLHHVKKLYPRDIHVLKSADAIVKTQPAANLKEFVNQRIRWISKGKYYSDFHIIITSAIVILANLAVLGWMMAALAFANVFYMVPLICKMFIDWIFMKPGLAFFGRKKLQWFIPLLSILYPFYVVFLSTAGLSCTFQWKGRHY